MLSTAKHQVVELILLREATSFRNLILRFTQDDRLG